MIFNNMLSLNDASNYSTWFYLGRKQGGTTQRGTPGYCVVHQMSNQGDIDIREKGLVQNYVFFFFHIQHFFIWRFYVWH